jgi:hypothetical protein
MQGGSAQFSSVDESGGLSGQHMRENVSAHYFQSGPRLVGAPWVVVEGVMVIVLVGEYGSMEVGPSSCLVE